MMVQSSDHHDNNNNIDTELQRKKKVKKNNPVKETDIFCSIAHITSSSLQTDAHLPQDFTTSNGLNSECSKRPRHGMSSYSSSEKQFVTFTLASVDGRHCRLRLPMQFTRENGITTPGKIYLLGKDGSKWLANLLQESRGRMTLGDGWKSFVKANGLKTGESYTFKLDWEDTTPVLMLCLDKYVTDTRVGEESSVASKEESLPIERSNNEKISDDDNKKDENNREENNKEENDREENKNDESNSRERENNQLICIDSTSPSQKRFLTLTITPDSLKHGRLRLPLEFMMQNSMNKPGVITLLGKDGAKWLASLLLEKRGRMSLGKGWKDFAKTNGLKTGDSITLESVWENTTPVLNLLHIQSSSGRGQSDFSKQSLSIEPSCVTKTKKADKNIEESKMYPPRSKEISSAIQNQFMALTLPSDRFSQAAHNLQTGEVVIFRDEGDNMLQVSDLEPSFCGIPDVTAPSRNNDHDSISSISKKIRPHLRKERGFSSYDGDSHDNFERPKKKKVKKHNPATEADNSIDHSCFVSHATTSSLHTNALSLAAKESLPIKPSIEKKISDENKIEENSKDKTNIEESSSWEKEKNHLRCIDSTLPSQNRLLTLTITPDSLKHGRLRLPLQFMMENSMNKPGELTLLDKFGMKWLVSLLLERRGRMSLGKGWKDFAKANNLKTGDSITLESIWEDETPVLSLLRVESGSGGSKESNFTEPSNGHKTRKESSSQKLEKRKYSPNIKN